MNIRFFILSPLYPPKQISSYPLEDIKIKFSIFLKRFKLILNGRGSMQYLAVSYACKNPAREHVVHRRFIDRRRRTMTDQHQRRHQ